MEQIEIGDLRIAFRRAGQGPPLVLLHGGISDSREWSRQLAGLSDAFTVVAWDAPGCGGSSDPPESFSMAEYADCLASFIDALGLGRPHVLGLSFGATLALELYRRNSTLPRTLVLASAYAGWAGSLPANVIAERLEAFRQELELPPEELARRWIPSLFTDQASAAMIDESVVIMSEFHPHGARTMIHAMAETDLRDVLPRIDVPTLLLYGEIDERSPLAVAEELHARIPRSLLVVLPGVGHQANVEAAEVFNESIRTFLRSQ